MKLQVRTVKSGQYELDGVDMSTKVGAIKQMLSDTHKAGAVAEQKLIYQGKVLKDDESLVEARIHRGELLRADGEGGQARRTRRAAS